MIKLSYIEILGLRRLIMEAYKQEFIEFMVASILEHLQSPVKA